jgi:hypothetical protein
MDHEWEGIWEEAISAFVRRDGEADPLCPSWGSIWASLEYECGEPALRFSCNKSLDIEFVYPRRRCYGCRSDSLNTNINIGSWLAAGLTRCSAQTPTSRPAAFAQLQGRIWRLDGKLILCMQPGQSCRTSQGCTLQNPGPAIRSRPVGYCRRDINFLYVTFKIIITGYPRLFSVEEHVYIATCNGVRVTKITGSSSDDWIY